MRGRTPYGMRPRYGSLGGVGLVLVGMLLSLIVVPEAHAAPRRRPAPVRYPVGAVDSVRVEGGTIRATGWAFDPDTAAPAGIILGVDRTITGHAANGYRPDVARAMRTSAFRGFDVRSGPVPPGRHFVCVAAVNVGAGFFFRILGCTIVDVGSADPIGRLDAVTSYGDRASVAGWTLDVQTWIPNEVRIDVDGVPTAQVRAMVPRADVGLFFPTYGASHGFDVSVPLTPGAHWVCATGLNLFDGADKNLGCQWVNGYAVHPFGVLDNVTPSGSGLLAQGWAIDPDAGGPATVVVTARRSDLVDPVVVTVAATDQRPDVGAAHGVATSGFHANFTGLEPGPHTICATISNRGYGLDRSLGCRTAQLADRRPQGNVPSIVPLANGVRVTGSVTDPDGGPVTIQVSVDGTPTTGTASPNFSIQRTGLAPGSHSVCVTAIDRPGSVAGVSGDRAWRCGTVVVGSGQTPGAGTGGEAGPPTTVAPLPGHPYSLVDRDGGVSVKLSDGSTLWLFGDSAEKDAAGNFKYFVFGTAAWAAPGQPAVTRDAWTSQPPRFATPVQDLGCPGDKPHQAMWPLSAVAQNDLVIAYMENVCIGEFGTESRGIAVVRWAYNRFSPPVDQPIVGTVVNQQLRPTRTYGSAAVIDPTDGLLYAYTCDGPVGGGWPDAYGPCHIARVQPSQAHVLGAYSYWNGSGWGANDVNAAITMPPAPAGVNHPVASLSVTYDDVHDLYVMVYSPWPGFTDRVIVRAAVSPEGPWTP
ncbi:MAG TPA: DUF4185 domain-containing protein, partial [Microthrixaceae bacterium]|nr:DUF4185 domain-containing protein [Microthrixaceae bacterium]